MMKHKVSELSGALLDAAVAKAEGWRSMPDGGGWYVQRSARAFVGGEPIDTSYHEPRMLAWSSVWADGGPIIERERIGCWPVERWETRNLDPIEPPQNGWNALHPENKGLGGFFQSGTVDVTERDGLFGPTLLIAAMRAYCASRFGDEVELP